MNGSRVTRAYVVVEARLPRKRVLVYAVLLTGTPSDLQEVSLGLGEESRVVGVFIAPDEVPDIPEP